MHLQKKLNVISGTVWKEGEGRKQTSSILTGIWWVRANNIKEFVKSSLKLDSKQKNTVINFVLR